MSLLILTFIVVAIPGLALMGFNVEVPAIDACPNETLGRNPDALRRPPRPRYPL